MSTPPSELVDPTGFESTPAASPSVIPDAAWNAMRERRVIIERFDNPLPIRGRLVAVTESDVVIIGDDGSVVALPKTNAATLRLDLPPQSQSSTSPTPPPVEKTPYRSRLRDRQGEERDRRDHPKFGIFTSHGLGYAHWRTPSFREGAATYALDGGVGYNFNERVGLYALLGGQVGAKLDMGDRETKANYGHLAAQLRYKRKYFAVLAGLGLGWTGWQEPHRKMRGVGLAVPLRGMGMIPLPKHIFLGLGVGWEPVILGRGYFVNGLSLQLTLGRW